MSKRSPQSPRPTTEPPTKVPKPDPAGGSANEPPTRTRSAHSDGNAPSSQNMPPPERRGPERAAGGAEGPRVGDAATATHGGMTTESGVQAGIGNDEPNLYDPQDPKHTATDTSRRDKADLDLYRKHFAGYREDRGHLSSNPYVESNTRLEDDEHHHHDFPGEREGGTDAQERRADPSLAYPTPATTQCGTPSQRTTRPPAMLGYTHSAKHEPGSPTSRLGEYQRETKGDKEGQWTERVKALREHAESQGASLRSMSPEDEPPSFSSDAPGGTKRRKSREEDEVHSREATMALYSYPSLKDGEQFFTKVPDGRREELEKVKRDLKDMETQLQNATKERISEVSATLDAGPSNTRLAPPPRKD